MTTFLIILLCVIPCAFAVFVLLCAMMAGAKEDQAREQALQEKIDNERR